MSWRLTIFTGMAALCCAVVVFELKGTVRGLDRSIAATQRQIEQQRWRLQTLKADFAYLTRPERLALQAAQLNMVPGSTKLMTKVEGLPFDTQEMFADKTVAVVLPGGETVQLRFKPALPDGGEPAGVAVAGTTVADAAAAGSATPAAGAALARAATPAPAAATAPARSDASPPRVLSSSTRAAADAATRALQARVAASLPPYGPRPSNPAQPHNLPQTRAGASATSEEQAR